jgi:hypothetical protein
VNPGHWTPVPDELARDERLTDLDVRVYLAIFSHERPGNEIRPGFGAIAKAALCKERAAYYSVAKLRAAGWLTVENRPGRANRYTRPPLHGSAPLHDDAGSGVHDGAGSPLHDRAPEVEEVEVEEVEVDLRRAAPFGAASAAKQATTPSASEPPTEGQTLDEATTPARLRDEPTGDREEIVW